MVTPPGYTEQGVLDIIDNVVNRLAPAYKFGYYDVEDIKQEGRILAIEVLEKGVYDPTRPLEAFLYSHLKKRYSNLKRDKFSRLKTPCPSCPFFDPKNKVSQCGNQCAAFCDKMECSKWAQWVNRNATKRNLVEPLDIGNVDDEGESNMADADMVEDTVELKELIEIINQKLDVRLRGDYLRMKSGVKIPKNRMIKVKEAILAIVEEYHGR